MKRIELGTVEFDPADATKNRGHDYGAGRKTEAHADKRNKRRNTRRDRVRDSMKGWTE